jgi:L-alanine-DL-glutamate epimerase-like enolase superfamily enzyme
VKVAPHFLMELHVSLCCAVSNSIYLEYIPQLGAVTKAPLRIEEGFAYPPEDTGIGIGFDLDRLEAYRAD